MADEEKKANEQRPESDSYEDVDQSEQSLEQTLYARHAEIKSLKELELQRGTSIPALFNQFYKFIQNPSTVSVETFKRMIDTDETIGSGMDFLITCLVARLGRYNHKSKEVTTWMNKRLQEMEGGWTNVVKEILSAAWAGFYVGEKVWYNTDAGFTIRKIIPLPPSTVLFETDWAGEITQDGILQYQRNYNPALMAGMGYFGGLSGSQSGFTSGIPRPDMHAKLGDLPFPIRSANTFNYLSIRIPRLKCVHYAFDAQGKFGNPYGRSLLRRAYKYYVMKDAFLQMLAIALDRKGTPLTVVYADPNVTLIDASKAGAAGNQSGKVNVGIRADAAAQKAFANIHNDSTIILPGKKGQTFDLEFAEQGANQDAFIAAIDMCNKAQMRALLVPSLIFGNGDGSGSFSLGQEHAKTFDKILDGMLAGAGQVLMEQVIREMIAYNFPASVWREHGFGEFGKRELSAEEREKEMACVETAVNMGAIDMNDLRDLNKIRDTIGFEERDTPIQQPGFDELGNPLAEVDADGNPVPAQEIVPGAEGEEGPPKPGAEAAPPKAKSKNPFKKLGALLGKSK